MNKYMKITKENTVKEILCRTKMFDNSYRPFHWHKNTEICQISEKCGRFLIDGKIVSAQKGDIVVIGEQVVHQFLIDEPGTVIRICQMSPKVLMDKDIGIKPIKSLITAGEIAAVENLGERLSLFFDILENDGGSDRVGDKPYIKTVAASIYYMLMNYFSEETHTAPHNDRQLFYKITEYVNTHFTEEVSVKSVAEKLYMSRGKVGSVFLKYSGDSLGNYINAIRIKNANMLMDSGTSITEAAMDSGFQNVRTFNGVYKKIMGITPSEYISKK